jgi:hypothetical protein
MIEAQHSFETSVLTRATRRNIPEDGILVHTKKNKFKRGYQTRSNLVKDENGDLLGNSNNIVNRWKCYFT